MTREVLANADIEEIELFVPAGHHHLRAVLHLRNGEELVLQEATVAALTRAFVTVKTHPIRERLRLIGRQMEEDENREGFAFWQLLEED